MFPLFIKPLFSRRTMLLIYERDCVPEYPHDNEYDVLPHFPEYFHVHVHGYEYAYAHGCAPYPRVGVHEYAHEYVREYVKAR